MNPHRRSEVCVPLHFAYRQVSTPTIRSPHSLHPDERTYTWWSFRGGARANDKGWRIDYQMVSESLRPHLRDAYHLKDDKHSDHCAVVVEYEGL